MQAIPKLDKMGIQTKSWNFRVLSGLPCKGEGEAVLGLSGKNVKSISQKEFRWMKINTDKIIRL